MSIPSPPDVFSPDEMRTLDLLAAREFGLLGLVLMENAGAGAARIAATFVSDPRGARIEVACGPGQNGGDGWVVARWLANAGARVHVTSTAPHAALRGDAAVNAQAAIAMGISWDVLVDAGDAAAFADRLADAHLAVDALLGTGSRGAPRGPVRAAIAEFERLCARPDRPRVLALDVPSGLDATSGERPGACVRADATATFGAWKSGFLAPGADAFLGRIEIVDLGVPQALYARLRAARAPVDGPGSTGHDRGGLTRG